MATSSTRDAGSTQGRAAAVPLRTRRPLDPATKYLGFPPVPLDDRTWPSKRIEVPPRWCSVDLRDGNQALIEPMDCERKRRLFDALVAIGFKEIEVGFPSASQADFDFVRRLIEENQVPEDVTIQVLTPAREDLIRRTFDAIRGARRTILHFYNSTSEVQRRLVFRQSRSSITAMAVSAARLIRSLAEEVPETEVVLEYSPESFSETELDFALDVCTAVVETWRPRADERVILNLPATVERSRPNVYADQIEFFSRRITKRERIVLSVHPHNDRGTAVAATELALMAGADRVEGTLFGNGERTGNVDLVTLALNLWTQGIDPQLDFSDINWLVRVVEDCNRLPVHPRHPYAGDLVFTAFSGSHQDAIHKGLEARRVHGQTHWEVPYLPIDPADLGRTYGAVIRINSQSGKAGIAHVLEEKFGYHLPRRLQIEFRQIVQQIADTTGEELTPEQILQAFETEYLADGRYALTDYRTMSEKTNRDGETYVALEAKVYERGRPLRVFGTGSGPLDAFVDALGRHLGVEVQVSDYRDHTLGRGAEAATVAYVEVQTDNGESLFGVGQHACLTAASLHAVISVLNRRDRCSAPDDSTDGREQAPLRFAGMVQGHPSS